MKNLLFAVGIFLFFDSALAQTNLLDKQLKNVNQSSVTSGIIYDRVTPLADLCVFNMPAEKPHNTADFRFFKQALFELHKASNQKKLNSIIQLEDKISRYKEMNLVPIGIINTPFQILNYNPINQSEGGLILKDSLFSQLPNKEPFLNGYAIIVSPLKNVVQGEQIIYKFSEELIFNNGTTSIKSLIADFDDGINHKIIENGVLIKNEIIKDNFKNNGDKKLKFIVELSNNFTFNTNGSIYTVYGNPENRSFNTQPIACSNNLQNSNNLIENFKLEYVEASETFQGLNESIALKGKIEARVFYHTNNGNSQKTMLKPIIIVDGFDPSDARKIDDCDCERDPVCQEANKDKASGVYNANNHTSFVELMEYKDQNNDPQNLINVLRYKGYDVILVNHPTYTTAGVTIDGGADFIQRNAMAFVQLMKEVNTKLQTNGSSEKIVVIGPSMGGQITRYALAYMEKKFAETGISSWKHNTRIWVAFDSPNLGANVPLGDQALIKMLAEDSVEAQKSFNKLQTIASNEMLINYYKENTTTTQNNNYSNASTISQGMPTDRGNPYFQEHYNRQFGSGLPNSNGFPMNLRKLAIVNGSLSGETFGNGYEKMLDVRLFKKICLINWNVFGWQVSSCFDTKLFEAETYTMPTSDNVVAHKHKLTEDSIDYNASTNSIRGNLDNIPGGSIDATGLLYSSITGEDLGGPRSFWQYTDASIGSFFTNHIGSNRWETRVNKPNQCFIPTFSSIGIKNPNQSWANPLNKNLVCSNETYFDSYFGEANNSSHVKLNYRSVNWLLKEIGSNISPPIPQAPHFPIQENALSGPNSFCTSATYSFQDICKIPSAVTWSVSSNLQIVSATSYSVTVSQISNGQGTITATFQNGQTITKTIWVGTPNPNHEAIRESHCSFNYRAKEFPNNNSNATFTWQYVSGTGGASINDFYAYGDLAQFTACPPFSITLKLIATNSCGTTERFVNLWLNNDQEEINRVSSIKDVKNQTTTNLFAIYPNPSNNMVNINLTDKNNKPEQNTTISGELFDLMGISKAKVEISDNKATFSVQGLNKGIYVLKIYINDHVESHKIAVE